jgi:hypothetical protein
MQRSKTRSWMYRPSSCPGLCMYVYFLRMIGKRTVIFSLTQTSLPVLHFSYIYATIIVSDRSSKPTTKHDPTRYGFQESCYSLPRRHDISVFHSLIRVPRLGRKISVNNKKSLVLVRRVTFSTASRCSWRLGPI